MICNNLKNLKRGALGASKAQTLSELAIFGAILVFIVGVIVRYALNFNFIQNQSLEAMRLAMRESFLSGEAGNASRTTGSVLFIEDRKEVENTKYGAQSRTPYMVGASGTFTRNLFMGTDWGETESLPIMDVYINGKHFMFSTGRFIEVVLDHPPDICKLCSEESEAFKCVDTNCTWNEWCLCEKPDCIPCGTRIDPNRFECTISPPFSSCLWNDICGCGKLNLPPPPPTTSTQKFRFDYNCSQGRWCVYFVGKAVLDDHYRFCSGGAVLDPCPSDFIAEDRFDLDQDGKDVNPADGILDDSNSDGIPDPDPDVPDFPEEIRRKFSWQWYKVRATNQEINMSQGYNVAVDVDGDLKEELIVEMVDEDNNVYRPHEVRNDTRNVELDDDEVNELIKKGRILAKVRVIDYQLGDLDFTYNEIDASQGKPQPGLIPEEAAILSFTKSGSGAGTQLVIKEGKEKEIFVGPSGKKQFAINRLQQDQMDLIERRIQLSNDTNRLYTDPCTDGDLNTVCYNPDVEYYCPHPNIPYDAVKCSNRANSCCYSTAIDSRTGKMIARETCFDRECLILYVRSNLKDASGRKWITDVEEAQKNK